MEKEIRLKENIKLSEKIIYCIDEKTHSVNYKKKYVLRKNFMAIPSQDAENLLKFNPHLVEIQDIPKSTTNAPLKILTKSKRGRKKNVNNSR